MSLSAGKHPEVRVTVEGVVDEVRAVSPRLLFFTIAEANGRSVECLAKERDGFLDENAIVLVSAKLTLGSRCALVGYPEVAPDSPSDTTGRPAMTVHAVQLTLFEGDTELRIPSTMPTSASAAVAVPVRVAPKPFTTSGNRQRPNNQSRHQRFAEFLVDTYGLEFLRSGAGVLDVAGGAGGVAFELAFRRGIPCTVVDPRPMKLTQKQRSALQHRVAGNQLGVFSEAQRAMEGAGGLCVGQASDAAAVQDGARDECAAADSAVALAPIAAQVARTATEEGVSSACLPRQLCQLFGMDFASEHPDLWSTCSVVVGMHPDQATEPIVDLALAHGKPFAVVPCCVFARETPGRRCRDGTPVEQHAEFCVYLSEKDGAAHGTHIARTELVGLEGRNDIIYGVQREDA
jgi:hypothetical protein